MLYGIIPGLGGQEMIVLLVLGVVLFGRKLPDLGRSLGSTIQQFRHGINGVEDHVSESRPVAVPEAVKIPQRVTARPKFDESPIPATVPAAV